MQRLSPRRHSWSAGSGCRRGDALSRISVIHEPHSVVQAATTKSGQAPHDAPWRACTPGTELHLSRGTLSIARCFFKSRERQGPHDILPVSVLRSSPSTPHRRAPGRRGDEDKFGTLGPPLHLLDRGLLQLGSELRHRAPFVVQNALMGLLR